MALLDLQKLTGGLSRTWAGFLLGPATRTVRPARPYRVSARPVSLVLDTSAIAAYATTVEAAVVTGMHADQWRTLAAMCTLLGRLDIAAGFVVAEVHGCDILTAEPDLYRVLGDDPPIIPIS